MIENKNYNNMLVPTLDDIIYKNCNFNWDVPLFVNGKPKGNRIFPEDDTPRTFINCNLRNVEPPPDSICESCLQVISQTDEESGNMIIYGKYIDGQYIYLNEPEVVG